MGWVQSASNSSAGTTLTLTLGTTPTTGNKIIVGIGTGDPTGSITSVKDGNGNSLTQCGVVSATDNGTITAVLYAYDVPATPSTTVTLTVTGSPDNQGIIQEVSGLAAGNTTAAMLDGTAASSHGGTTTYTSPTYSSTASGEYLVQLFVDNGGPEAYALTANGYKADGSATVGGANDHGINNNALGDVEIFNKSSTHASESSALTLSGSACGWAALMVAFKVAGGTQHNQTAAATPTSTSQAYKKIPRSYLATTSSASTMTSIKVKMVNVLATMASSGVLGTQLSRVLKALATALSTGIESDVVTLHQTGVSVTSTVTVTSIKVKILNALASVVSTPRLVRRVGTSMRALGSSGATVVKQASTKMRAAVTSTASMVRQIARQITAPATSSSTTISIKAHLLTILASITSTSQAARFIGKLTQATATSTSKLTRALSTRISVAVASTPALVRSIARTIIASITSAGSAIANRGTQTFDVAVRALANTTSTLGFIKVKIVNAFTSVTSSSGLVNQIGKVALATPTTAASIARRIASTIAVLVSSVAQFIIGRTRTPGSVTITIRPLATATLTVQPLATCSITVEAQ